MMDVDDYDAPPVALVADPIPFPNPVIRRCHIRRLKIEIAPGVMESKPVLESALGNYYEIGSVLKNAIFGKVVHAIVVQRDQARGNELVFLRTSEHRAIKVYSRSALRTLQGRVQENPLQEITAMQFIGCSHPHVMGQIECAMDDENIYSVMKFCPGGEFFDYINDNGPLTDAEARAMFAQVLDGLAHLHELGVGHRDMSLENILFDGTNVYVIIDFGMCLRLKPTDDVSDGAGGFYLLPRQPVCGKKNYIAPEVFVEQTKVFDPRVCDIWALGIILFIALTGVPPVDMATRADDRFLMVIDGKLQEMVDTWGLEIDPSAVDLVQRILNPDPARRMTLPEIRSHPWMLAND